MASSFLIFLNYFLCYFILSNNNLNVCGDVDGVIYKSISSRVRRQAGYIYDRPSVAFDLPTRQPSSTEAPSSVPTQAQQMYYAYPVPGGGNTASTAGVVNIGYSTAGSPSSPTFSSTPGSFSGPTGYNYESSTSNAKTSITSGTTIQSTSGITGYNYGGPISTTGSSPTQPTNGPSFSTNAPTYLPPTAGPGSNQILGSSQVPASTATIGSLPPSSVADSYLPPLTSAPNQGPLITPPGLPSSTPGPSPSTGYLPPQSPAAGSTQTSSPTSSPPYVSPVTLPSTPRPVSTPAPTYLPPLL